MQKLKKNKNKLQDVQCSKIFKLKILNIEPKYPTTWDILNKPGNMQSIKYCAAIEKELHS